MALTDNLVSYYKLDEASGNATDSVGSNTLTNNGTATYSAGKINNGVSLASASSQYLQTASPTGLPTGASAFSVSLWLKKTTNPGAGVKHGQVYFGTNATRQLCYIVMDGNVGTGTQITFATFSDDINSVATITTGTWYHIVATYDGSVTTKLYINGSLDTTRTLAAALNVVINAGGLIVGGDYLNGTSVAGFDNGMIDEVGIWSRALTSTEITQLYNSGAGLQYPFSTTANPAFLLKMI